MTAVALFVGVVALVWLIVTDHAARHRAIKAEARVEPQITDWGFEGWVD